MEEETRGLRDKGRELVKRESGFFTGAKEVSNVGNVAVEAGSSI